MGQLFNLDSPLMQGFGKLGDMIILNLLALVCSLPIVTLGASAAALYYAMEGLREEKGHLVLSFFRAFKTNFKQATVQWLILLVLGVVLAVSLVFYLQFQMSMGRLLLGLVILLAVVWCITVSWAFPLQAKFSNTISGTLRNALLCALAYLPRSLVMSVLNLLPIALFMFFPYWFFRLGILWIFIWYALAAFLILKLLKKPYTVLMKTSQDGEAPEQE